MTTFLLPKNRLIKLLKGGKSPSVFSILVTAMANNAEFKPVAEIAAQSVEELIRQIKLMSKSEIRRLLEEIDSAPEDVG